MSKFRVWYIRYQEVISGFIAGVMTVSGIDNLIAGYTFHGMMMLALAGVNLYMVSQRM